MYSIFPHSADSTSAETNPSMCYYTTYLHPQSLNPVLDTNNHNFGEGTSGNGVNQRDISANYDMEVLTRAEKRFRRKIKNRESAARSRARKQAYTKQLEFEINELKMENVRLKRRIKVLKLYRRRITRATPPTHGAQKSLSSTF